MIPLPVVLEGLLTNENVWHIIHLIRDNPRFKYGLLSLFLGGATLQYILCNVYPYLKTQWKIAARKHVAKERKRAVKETCANGSIQDVSGKDIEELLKNLRKGRLTAERVLKAFQIKALQLDQDLNMITEPVMEALDQARQLDKGPDKDGMLYGIPVSIKECFALAGYDRTGGVAFFLDNIANEDAIVVKALKSHGAIPFVRTNIPQAMMGYGSSNFIYGETSNPRDKTRGPGGSSSGEGAVVGGGGSLIGIGSDIGGSIRIPAAFCGCYSLKPTSDRISEKGAIPTDGSCLTINNSVCPIAIDMKSLTLACRALMSDIMYQLDPEIPYQPFNKERFEKTGPMRIGYYVFDGNIRCQPPVVRAVMEAKVALIKKGHTVIPVTISDMSPPGFDPGEMYGRLLLADGCQRIRDILRYEQYDKGVKLRMYLTMFPAWLMKALSFIVSFKEKALAQDLRAGIGFNSVNEYLDHTGKVQKWKRQFMNTWLSMELDAIICPVFPSVAPKKEWAHLLTGAGVYCLLFNSLDYPSGVLPVTKVTRVDVQNTVNPNVYRPSNTVEHMLMKSVPGSEGMPVGIQCVALPHREETCLRVMREVEAGLNKNQK